MGMTGKEHHFGAGDADDGADGVDDNNEETDILFYILISIC